MDVIAAVFSLEGKGEVRVWSDDCNLPQVFDDFGPVVLPVPQNGDREVRPMPSVGIVNHPGFMDIGLIPESNMSLLQVEAA